jgi:uncharacterized SAM-binding protein YcdF (DUF218 family)
LGDFGVPDVQILREENGRDTLSSVRAVARLLRERADRGPIYVATSAYHQPRCVILLRLAGLDARACPPPAAPAALRLGKRWYWRLRELVALPVDVMLMLMLRARGRI